METLKNKISASIVAALLAGATLLLVLAQSLTGTSVPEAILGGFDLYKTASSSATSVGSTSTLITGTSTARSYVAIVNDGDNDIYLMFDDRVAVAGRGLRLNSGGGSFEINDTNLYKGAIRAITWTGNSTTTFVELY